VRNPAHDVQEEKQPEPVDYFSSTHPLRKAATEVAYRARKRMFDYFRQVMPVTPGATVLDVGVTPDRSLKDSNFFEQFYPYKDKITATSIEDASFLEKQYPGLRFIQTSGLKLPFADKTFDIVFCSAVLEHVGDRASQKIFIDELLRVSRHFFITTPNRQFPVEMHTFLPLLHWLPQPAHQAVLRKLGMNFWASTENLNLLSPDTFLKLFPGQAAVKLHQHRLLGLPSNLIGYGSIKDDFQNNQAQ
jgi:SAM-dependent methyltransferase